MHNHSCHNARWEFYIAFLSFFFDTTTHVTSSSTNQSSSAFWLDVTCLPCAGGNVIAAFLLHPSFRPSASSFDHESNRRAKRESFLFSNVDEEKPLEHQGNISRSALFLLFLLGYFFYLAQSPTCERFLSLCVSLSTIPLLLQHWSLFSCLFLRAHAHHNRPPADKPTEKILFSLLRYRCREKEKKKARKSNSLADWSRVTVHIKSNYKCSFVFSLSLPPSARATASVFLSLLRERYFSLLCTANERERKRESAKRWDVCARG